LCSATAAKRVIRATADKALEEFLGRLEQVNSDVYFLGKVTRVVLVGSMVKPEIERLSDVDLAGEIVEKEPHSERAGSKNYDRVEELAAAEQARTPSTAAAFERLSILRVPVKETT
jgi:hypothetical protein